MPVLAAKIMMESNGPEIYNDGLGGVGYSLEYDSEGRSYITADFARFRVSETVGQKVFQGIQGTDGEVWLTSTGKVKNIEIL